MLRVVLVDDERRELEKTEAMIRACFAQRKVSAYTVEAYTEPDRLLEALSRGEKADVYILDIVMPMLSGIDLGARMKQLHPAARIIYLTTSEEYGVASYEVQAVDYLVKPCAPARLQKALERALGMGRQETAPRFFVKVPDGAYALPQREILYAEYYDHRLMVHTADGRTIESITQRESLAVLAEPLLQEDNFLRISASFVINLDHVVKLSRNEFEMQGGKRLQISRTYSDSRSRYLDYVLEKN